MRIIVASASYPTPEHPKFLGGAETFAVQLCEGVAARGHSVCVVRSGPVRGAWRRETLNGVDIVTLPTRNLYSPWEDRSKNRYVRAAWHLVEDRPFPSSAFESVLREFMPDVLHTNSLYGLTTAVWPKAHGHGLPVVHTLHDYYLTCARSTRFNNGVRCQTSCVDCSCLTINRRHAASFVDTIVGVSHRTLAIHRSCGLFKDTARSLIIHNPPPTAKADLAPVKTGNGKITFGFIGRPSLEKGIFDLLAAVRKIPAGLSRLLVAGAMDPDLRKRLIESAGGAECIFLGFVPPSEFFQKIDVMVIPSLWEDPCPMVIGESFAYARPVIGARRGGIPELINDASGWLYEPGTDELEKLLVAVANNKSSIVDKSQYLLSKPPQRDFDSLVSEYISTYQDAIDAHGESLTTDRTVV